jgi:hypothetical protein
MFIVLCATGCKYCTQVQLTLDDLNEYNAHSYQYINLDDVYDDWRKVFTDLGRLNDGGQVHMPHKIPLIFCPK